MESNWRFRIAQEGLVASGIYLCARGVVNPNEAICDSVSFPSNLTGRAIRDASGQLIVTSLFLKLGRPFPYIPGFESDS